MNKWEDSFRKSGEQACHCSSNQGLFVPNRQLSFIVAGLSLLSFCIFMTGYFLGKKNVVEQFTEKMQVEAFSDQVYTAVLATTQENEQVVENNLLVTDTDVADVLPQSINQDIVVAQLQADAEQSALTRYYAQLIGFGAEKSAQAFVKKLATKGIDTEIKKRVSTTAKGRTSYWYQVVTTAYTNKSDLSELVDRIAKEENIKGACIRVC